MHVKDPKFLFSGVEPEHYPQYNVPEIALAGRSNVGKSSFINKMINRRNLARTSSRPGKTQTLNFYDIDGKFRIVDVPGYGYAQVSKSDRHEWAEMIDTYLETRENLAVLFLLMDFRHPPTDLDIAMMEFAETLEIPFAVVLTKVDKIKKSQRQKHLNIYKRDLGLETTDALFPFSSETGEGRQEIWDVIQSQLDI